MSFWGSKQLIGRVSTDSERATARGRPAGGGGGWGAGDLEFTLGSINLEILLDT